MKVGQVIQRGTVGTDGTCQFAFTINGEQGTFFDAQTDDLCVLRLASKDPSVNTAVPAALSDTQQGPQPLGWCGYPNTATGSGYVRSYSVVFGIQYESARVSYQHGFEYNNAYACLDSVGPGACSKASNYQIVANTCKLVDGTVGPANPVSSHGEGRFIRNDGQYDHTMYVWLYGWNDGHTTCTWSHIGSVEYGVSGGC